MGKLKIADKENKDKVVGESTPVAKTGTETSKKLSRRRLETGILYVQSTFNNTKVLLTDQKGNAVCATSSGQIGFAGAKKGTPFAAAKAAEILAEKAEQMGLKNVKVIVKGVGSGREAAIRGFISRGVQILSITDETPVPHNGPKPKKPRRI
jgi:small subunit ribosomal protein S11